VFVKLVSRAVYFYCASVPQWESSLPWALFSLRTQKNAALGKSPYEVLYGTPPFEPVDVVFPALPTGVDTLNRARREFNIIQPMLRAKIEQAQQRAMKFQHRKSRSTNVRVGDNVVLVHPSLKRGLSRKFQAGARKGFRVVEQLSPVNFRITDGRWTQIVHCDRLRKVWPRPDHMKAYFEPVENPRRVVVPERILRPAGANVERVVEPQPVAQPRQPMAQLQQPADQPHQILRYPRRTRFQPTRLFYDVKGGINVPST
jgi:hypothetical protein